MLFIPPISTLLGTLLGTLLLIPNTTAWIHSPSTNTWIAEDAYYELASGHVVHEACRIRGSHWWGVFGQTCSYVNNEGKIQYECEHRFDEGECLIDEW
jgi:hypothetical protein